MQVACSAPALSSETLLKLVMRPAALKVLSPPPVEDTVMRGYARNRLTKSQFKISVHSGKYLK